MLKRILDLKDTFEGKFLAVLMSAVLVLSMTNVFAFAGADGAASQGVSDDPTAQEAVQQKAESADSSGGTPATPIVSNEVGEAVVAFDTENAYVSVKGQVLSGKTLTTELHKELTFAASSDTGYELDSVTAKNAANASVPVVAQDGMYTVAADYVDSTLVVTVTTKAVAVSEPAVETTPITGNTVLNGDTPPQADAQTVFHTVTFTVSDATYETKKIEDGATCAEPEIPTVPEGFVAFLGWYQKLADGTVSAESFDFSTPIVADTELVAKFSDKWVVLFKDADDKVVETQEVSNGQKAKQPEKTPVAPPAQEFDAWYLDGQPYDFDTPVTGNITLTPHFVDTYYVYFVSKGSAVPSTVVREGSTVTQPASPTREGYSFRYWSTSEDGSTGAYDFTQPVANDLVLYGVWQGGTVDYTVVYWFEKPNLGSEVVGDNPANFQFDKSETRSATAGSTVSGDNLWRLDPSSNASKYGYYAFSDTATIAGNGTTVLNVYYKRTVYTVTLNPNGGTMVFNGTTYNRNNTYSFKAKYEQDIDTLWASSKNATFTGTSSRPDFLKWGSKYASHRLTLTNDMIDGYGSRAGDKATGTLSFDASWGSARKVQVNYWLQVADDSNLPAGAYQDRTTGKWYSKDNAYTQVLYLGGDLDPKAITGFEDGKSKGSSWNEYNFYYDRKTYTLTYDARGGTVSPDTYRNIRYEAPLSKYQPADPTRDGYTFKGWYYDSDCYQPVDFSAAVMPNNGLTLFAKWESSQYTASFYNHEGDTDPVVQQGIADTGYVKDPGTYIQGRFYEGLGQFEGWYWYLPGTERLVAYSWETPVSGDVTLYAHWKTDGFKVTYDLGEGWGTAPVDQNDYDLGVLAPVADAIVTAPSGKIFVGWQVDGQGRTYYPHTTVQINGDTNLVARYVDPAKAIYLNFDGNFEGAGSPVQWIAEVGDQVTIPGSLFEREGYDFVKWTINPDGSGASYAKDSTLTMLGTTTLYAQWVKRVDVSVEKVWDNPGSGLDANPSIKLQLYRNGTPFGSPVELKNGELAYTFQSLPAVDASGREYHYTVQEASIGGVPVVDNKAVVTVEGVRGTVSYSVSTQETAANSFKITNTRNSRILTVSNTTVDKTTASAESLAYQFAYKVNGNNESLADGDSVRYAVEQGSRFTASVTANQSTWTTERVSGSTSGSGTSIGGTIDGDTAVDFTNTRIPLRYNVNKLWVTDDESTVSEVLPITVYQSTSGDAPFGSGDVVFTGQMSSWTKAEYSWDGMLTCPLFPFASIDGTMYHYCAKEETQPSYMEPQGGYTGWSSDQGSEDPDGIMSFTGALYNYFNKTSVSGTKTWIDFEETTHDTAAEVELALYRSADKGSTWQPVEGAAPQWEGNAFTFANLEKYQGNNPHSTYLYKVVETNAAEMGYLPTYDGSDIINQQIRALSVTADNNHKTYDGTALTDDGFTVEIGGATYTSDGGKVTLDNGDVVRAVVEGSATNVGDDGTNAVTSYKVTRGLNGEDITGAYKVNAVDGKLAIDPRPVTFTGESESLPYTGFQQEITGITAGATEGVGGLLSGHEYKDLTYSAKGTDADTYDGEFSGAVRIVDASGIDVTDNYAITQTPGTLTIDASSHQVVVTVVGNNNSFDYNGTPRQVTGYSVTSISDPLYTEQDFSFTGEAVAERTDAGTSYMGLSASQFTNISKNFTSVRFDVTDGWVQVNPITAVVGIVGHSNTFDYDGTQKTVTGYDTVLPEGSLYKETDFTYSGSESASRIVEGTTYMNLDPNKFVNTNKNFKDVTFEVTDGWVKVNPVTAKVTVTAGDADKTYDGTPLAQPGFTAAGALAAGDYVADVVMTDDSVVTDAGPAANRIASYTIRNAAGEDVTSSYANVELRDGKLRVDPAALHVSTPSASKPYDGTPLTAAGTMTGLVSGETAAFSTTGTATDVNAPDGTPNTYAIDWNGTAKQSNYTVSEDIGTLKVTAAPATELGLKTTDGFKVYDGTALESVPATASVTKGTVIEYSLDGDAWVAEAPSRTDAGSTLVYVRATNPNYQTATGSYTLTVDKKQVVVNADDKTKAYGDPNPALTYTVDPNAAFVGSDTLGSLGIEPTLATTATDRSLAGDYPIEFSGTTAETDNYRITYNPGTLIVTQNAGSIVIAAENASRPYDGTPLTHDGFKVSGILAAGDYVTDVVMTEDSTITDAGWVQNKIASYVIRNAEGKDVTSSYAGTSTAPGTLTVTRLAVTVKANDNFKTYGEADPAFNATVDGTINGDTVDYELARPGVGTDENAGTYIDAIEASGAAEQGNYTVSYAPGTFIINELSAEVVVTVAERSATHTYDGTQKSVTGYDVKSISNPLYKDAYFAFSGVAEASGTDADFYPMNVKADDFTNNNANFTNVRFVVEDGGLTINPVEAQVVVTVVGNSNTFDYDGTPHLVTGYNVTAISDPLYKDADFAFSGNAAVERTVEGTSHMGLAADQFVNTNKNFKDVTFEVTDGWVKVNPVAAEVTVTAGDADKTYDGAPLVQPGFTAAGALAAGDYVADVVMTDDSSVTDAGPAANRIASYTIRNAAGEDVTSSYANVELRDGKLRVDPAALHVSTPSASKPYDGTPLTAAGTMTGLVNGEAAGFSTTGTATDVNAPDGTPNTYAIDWNGTAKQSNYTVLEDIGTLTVTESTHLITVTTTGGTFVYDGQPHGATVDVTELPAGYTLDQAASSAAATDVTASPVKATADTLVIRNAAGVDVTSRLNIAYIDGSIIVNPATLTVTGASDTVTYNGSEQEITGIETAGLIGGHQMSGLSYSAKGTDADTYDGAFFGSAAIVDATGADVTGNYNVVRTPGTLTIAPVEAQVVVAIVGNNDTQVYDATAHTASGYRVAGISNPLYTEADFSLVGDATATLTDAGTANMGLTADSFANVSKNFANVVFDVADGWMKVEPAMLTITADDNGKVYGQADPELTASVTGLRGDDRFTGSYDVTRAPGEDANRYAISVDNAVSGSSNYTVETVPGTFVITPLNEAALVVGTFTKTYDGTPLHPDGVTPVGLVPGDYVDGIMYDGQQTDVGSSAATIVDFVIRNAEGVDVTANYTDVAVVPGTVEVVPATIVVTADDQAKIAGAADPQLTYTFSGAVNNEAPGFAGTLEREAGEGVGNYAINQGALVLTDNGAFKAANYTLSYVQGTLAITAAPVPPVPPVPPTPTPLPPPVTPTPTPAGPVEVIAEALQAPVEAIIGEPETPLANIDDNETPLANHPWCWVHFYIILGIIVTAVYTVCVATRRGLFSHKLKKYEDDLTGGGDPAPGASTGTGKDTTPPVNIPKGTPATAASGLGE